MQSAEHPKYSSDCIFMQKSIKLEKKQNLILLQKLALFFRSAFNKFWVQFINANSFLLGGQFSID
jgi:hypothetical protein